MEVQDYNEKLKKIQEAVAGLEEPLKSKAIDKLLEEAFSPTNSKKRISGCMKIRYASHEIAYSTGSRQQNKVKKNQLTNMKPLEADITL